MELKTGTSVEKKAATNPAGNMAGRRRAHGRGAGGSDGERSPPAFVPADFLPPDYVVELGDFLGKEQDRYAELYDFMPLPLFTVDRIGIIRELNHRATTLLGAARSSLLGKTFVSLMTVSQRSPLRKHLAACRRSKSSTPLSMKSCLETPGGELPVEVVTLPAPDPSRPAYWICLRELTDERLAEGDRKRLLESEQAARAAAEAKEIFIAVLGHELRSPLAAIGASAAVIKRGELSPDQLLTVANRIERNVQAQSRLIEDLMDATSVLRGKVSLALESIDLHEIAQDAVAGFAVEIAGKSLKITVDLTAQRYVVNGDELRLRQVLWNLVKNAIKFTPAGGSVMLRSWNNGNILALEVSDTGVGIEPETLPRLFEPFEQAKRGSGGGVGLGLAIARGIVDLHKGRLIGTSAGTGRGARFVVELETVEVPRAAAAEVPLAQKGNGERRRVLLVEDKEDLSESLASLLDLEGFEVVVAPTFAAAMQTDLASIDVVLSDLGLPDRSGLELPREIRANFDVPVIALSGYAGDRDRMRSQEAGFVDHIAKPIAFGALLKAIQTALRGRRKRALSAPTESAVSRGNA